MNARVEQGWIVVDCDAPDVATVELGLDPAKLQPAFRDYSATGVRVAQIRVPAEATGRVRVYIKVDGRLEQAGLITL